MNTTATRWIRVSKAQPCLICQKFDWCTVAPEIGLACCMRVESNRPAKNGGWMHELGDKTKLRPAPIAPERMPVINAGAIMATFSKNTFPEMVEQLSQSLGVTVDALDALGAAWATGYNAWAFPMKNWEGQTIGIRLRDHTGHKWAIKGSRAGLLYAEGESRTIYVCEGPTDTAAGLSMGMAAVGRPSCMGSEEETNRLVRRRKAREVILVCDNDGPGYRGAIRLAAVLCVPCVLWVPPAKDLRQFYRDGGTKEMVTQLCKPLVWIQPKPQRGQQ